MPSRDRPTRLLDFAQGVLKKIEYDLLLTALAL
jgi:hypothetical protein